jgi:regulator of replication initiation timing
VRLGGPIERRESMAAESQSIHDPALDLAIKQLLDQQAEIQAKLAALLPEKYGPNVKLELEMLRHKLSVLQAYADHHSKFVTLPRQLLY